MVTCRCQYEVEWQLDLANDPYEELPANDVTFDQSSVLRQLFLVLDDDWCERATDEGPESVPPREGRGRATALL